MKNFNFVVNDPNRKKAILRLIALDVKGYVVKNPACEGLYWFNTDEGMEKGHRDMMVDADQLVILLKANA